MKDFVVKALLIFNIVLLVIGLSAVDSNLIFSAVAVVLSLTYIVLFNLANKDRF
jgi:hypothetical protein